MNNITEIYKKINDGEMPERLNGTALNTDGPKGHVGSNPTLSAKTCHGKRLIETGIECRGS